MSLIYTKKGDDGCTNMNPSSSKKRVSKSSLRVEAIGSVDEVNSAIAHARSLLTQKEQFLDPLLDQVQQDLFAVQAELASNIGEEKMFMQTVEDNNISWLETVIDKFDNTLPPVKQFVLGTGTKAGSFLHFTRALSRKAERTCVKLHETETLSKELIAYVNRLSDFLYIVARASNICSGKKESHPRYSTSTELLSIPEITKTLKVICNEHSDAST